MSELNALDLAFIVDTTGSMGSLISAAQQQMIAMINALTQAADVDIRLGIVEYRDHPPQDKLVFRAYAFTSNLNRRRRLSTDSKPRAAAMGRNQSSMACWRRAKSWSGVRTPGVSRCWWVMRRHMASAAGAMDSPRAAPVAKPSRA